VAVPLFSAASRAALSPASCVGSSLLWKAGVAAVPDAAGVAVDELDPDVAVVLVVAAVAPPALKSVAPTAPPASSDPTTPAAAIAFLVRFMDDPPLFCDPDVGGEIHHPGATSGRRWPRL